MKLHALQWNEVKSISSVESLRLYNQQEFRSLSLGKQLRFMQKKRALECKETESLSSGRLYFGS